MHRVVSIGCAVMTKRKVASFAILSLLPLTMAVMFSFSNLDVTRNWVLLNANGFAFGFIALFRVLMPILTTAISAILDDNSQYILRSHWLFKHFIIED